MFKKSTAFLLTVLIPICLDLPIFASQEASVPVPEQSWLYIENQEPSVSKILALSLGGRSIDESLQDLLETQVKQVSDSSSVQELESSALLVAKLGKSPSSFGEKDLLSMIYQREDLLNSGLDGAVGALNVYQTAGVTPPQNVRNSTQSLIDYVVSSQLQVGGFALSAGGEPSLGMTARVVVSLAPFQEIPYVASSLEKAVSWMSEQQNPDGSFSSKEQSDCSTTAQVYTAVSLVFPEKMDTNFSGLHDALLRFRNNDGGYAPFYGESSQLEASLEAVVALQTQATGLSPYLPPRSYPNYTAPDQAQPDPVQTYIKFAFGFVGIFFLVYLLLISTPKVARWVDKRRGKEPAMVSYPSSPEKKEDTLKIQIPMKAELPDFDTITEKESVNSSFPKEK